MKPDWKVAQRLLEGKFEPRGGKLRASKQKLGWARDRMASDDPFYISFRYLWNPFCYI